MKTDNYNTRRFAPCFVMYLLSAILMTWRLWLPDYVQYAPSGDRALYTTVVLEIMFAALFFMFLSLKLNMLNCIQHDLQKIKTNSSLTIAIFSVGIMLFSYLVQIGINALDSNGAGNYYGHSCCLLLNLVFYLAKGPAASNDLDKSMAYRFALIPVLTAMSILLLDGFSPALYIFVMIAVSDVITILRLRDYPCKARAVIVHLLPPVLCVGLILAIKAVFFPEVLDFQLRTIVGKADSYSLGLYVDFLRESGVRGVICGACYFFMILVAIPVTARLVSSDNSRFRVFFLGCTALIFASSGLIQAILNAELAHRWMPFQWMISGGLVVLLSNSIFQEDHPQPWQKQGL